MRLGVALLCAAGAFAPLAARADSNFPGLETVIVTGRADDLTGIAPSANAGIVGAADLALRPLLRQIGRAHV